MGSHIAHMRPGPDVREYYGPVVRREWAGHSWAGTVLNLGWLLRHAGEVQRMYLYDAIRYPNGSPVIGRTETVLTMSAHLERTRPDGIRELSVFTCVWGSLELARAFMGRRIFAEAFHFDNSGRLAAYRRAMAHGARAYAAGAYHNAMVHYGEAEEIAGPQPAGPYGMSGTFDAVREAKASGMRVMSHARCLAGTGYWTLNVYDSKLRNREGVPIHPQSVTVRTHPELFTDT